MTYFFTLAHFCETHGPVSLITTRKRTLTHVPLPIPTASTCESCELRVPSNTNCIVSKGAEGIFLSSASFNSKVIDEKIRSVVLRAMSEEASSKLCVFGDTTLMYSISRCFSLKDPSARGKTRKYGLIITSDHQTALMANAAKVCEFFHYMYKTIKVKHVGYLASLNTIKRDTKIKLSRLESSDSESDGEQYFLETIRSETVALRNLADLVDDAHIYMRIHCSAVMFLNSLGV